VRDLRRISAGFQRAIPHDHPVRWITAKSRWVAKDCVDVGPVFDAELGTVILSR
jgi:hypothetical protein